MIRRVASQVDEAAFFRLRTTSYMVRFANDEVTVFKRWTSEQVSLYVAKNRKAVLTSSTGDLGWTEVERALARLDSLPEDPLYVPLSCKPQTSPKEDVENYEKLVDVVKDAIDNAERAERNAGAAVVTYVTAEYENSHDQSGSYALSRVYLVMRSFAGDLSSTVALAARRVGQLDGKLAGVLNSQLLDLARGLPVKRAEPGSRDLLLSPLVWGSIMGELTSLWASGSEVISQSSRYTPSDVGSVAASPVLTLEEGAWRGENYGHLPFDSEGCNTRRVEIFKRGVLNSFIHTLRSARHMGVEPTGHAVEAYFRASPRHVEVSPGDGPADLESLFKELKAGYYVHGNWYTRYQNVKTGQFSTVGRDTALEIREGRPVAVVKFVRIADTLESLVRNVETLSRTTLQTYWWDMRAAATSPYAVVRNVGVST